MISATGGLGGGLTATALTGLGRFQPGERLKTFISKLTSKQQQAIIQGAGAVVRKLQGQGRGDNEINDASDRFYLKKTLEFQQQNQEDARTARFVKRPVSPTTVDSTATFRRGKHQAASTR